MTTSTKNNKIYLQLLEEARKEKLKINKDTLLKTKKLYKEVIKDLQKRIKSTNNYNNKFVKAQIRILEQELREMDIILEREVTMAITDTSLLMSSVNADFYSMLDKEYNLHLSTDMLSSMYSTNNRVIQKIVGGGLYKDKRSLSERVWKYSEKNISDIQDILVKGIIERKSLEQLCRELSVYCGGGNTKIPAITRSYGRMNSNALRLVRTSLNHVFIETMKDECEYNPFVEGYKWELSPEHDARMGGRKDECDDYANHNEGMGVGMFRKDTLPGVPHCNCLCIIVPHIVEDFESIGARLKKWVDGGKDIEIDKWVEKTYKNR